MHRTQMKRKFQWKTQLIFFLFLHFMWTLLCFLYTKVYIHQFKKWELRVQVCINDEKSLIFPVKIYFLAAVSRCCRRAIHILITTKYTNSLCTKSISLTFDSQKYLFFIRRGKKARFMLNGNSWAHNIASPCALVFEQS